MPESANSEVVLSFWLHFFLRPTKVQGSIASFRTDGDCGISYYLVKLMKSSLFFFLLKIEMLWENCVLCLMAAGSSPE